jgi:hypothetical protein
LAPAETQGVTLDEWNVPLPPRRISVSADLPVRGSSSSEDAENFSCNLQSYPSSTPWSEAGREGTRVVTGVGAGVGYGTATCRLKPRGAGNGALSPRPSSVGACSSASGFDGAGMAVARGRERPPHLHSSAPVPGTEVIVSKNPLYVPRGRSRAVAVSRPAGCPRITGGGGGARSSGDEYIPETQVPIVSPRYTSRNQSVPDSPVQRDTLQKVRVWRPPNRMALCPSLIAGPTDTCCGDHPGTTSREGLHAGVRAC